jgi:hypothetical protein
MVSQDWKTHRSHRIFTKTEKTVFARKPNLVSVKIESSYSKKINFYQFIDEFSWFSKPAERFFLGFQNQNYSGFSITDGDLFLHL